MIQKLSFLAIIGLVYAGCAPAPAASQPATLPPTQAANPEAATLTPENLDYELTKIPTVSRPRADLPEGFTYLQTWCNDKADAQHNFPKNTAIGFKYGWSARELSQIEEFLRIAVAELTLDGEQIDFDGRTEAIYNEATDDYTVWFYKLIGIMEMGSHQMKHRLVFTEAYTDGVEQYGPGTAIEESIMSCDFVIEE